MIFYGHNDLNTVSLLNKFVTRFEMSFRRKNFVNNIEELYLFTDTGIRICVTSCREGLFHLIKHRALGKNINTACCMRPREQMVKKVGIWKNGITNTSLAWVTVRRYLQDTCGATIQYKMKTLYLRQINHFYSGVSVWLLCWNKQQMYKCKKMSKLDTLSNKPGGRCYSWNELFFSRPILWQNSL